MKDTVKDLKERRSIKKYQDRQIEEEDLQDPGSNPGTPAIEETIWLRSSVG